VYNSRRDLVDLLINRGADVDARNHRQDTPLHWACQFGDRVIVQRLIQAGCNVHARETQAQTPIFMAVSAGQVEIVQLLIRSGSSVNVRDCEDIDLFDFIEVRSNSVLLRGMKGGCSH
jgi:hypothetical protein